MRVLFPEDLHSRLETYVMNRWDTSEPTIPMFPIGREVDTEGLDAWVQMEITFTDTLPAELGPLPIYRANGIAIFSVYTKVGEARQGRTLQSHLFLIFTSGETLTGFRFDGAQTIPPLVEGRWLRTQMVVPFTADHAIT